MYMMLGICLGLAALLIFNALASLLATVAWRAVEEPARRWSAETRASILFALRVIPIASALVAVAMFLIPSYVAYEPHSTTESVSLKFALVALLSASGIALAIWRGCASWRATRALLADWLSDAEPVRIASVSIPAYRIPHKFPVIAVVGTVRPRLFVAGHVLDALSDEEMAAAVAHECGHLSAHDNLKRILMRACCDVLTIVPCGRVLDRAWAENAEAAADEYAARSGSAVALNLASALIEIARMVPAGARPTMPVGTFLLGHEGAGVMWRVCRLIDLATTNRSQGPHDARTAGFAVWAWRVALCSLLVMTIFTVNSPHVLATMHAATEQVVQVLN